MRQSARVTFNISISDLEKVIFSLPLPEKIQLARRLDEETWEYRLKTLLKAVDKRLRAHPISMKEALEISEQVRQRRYDRSRRRQQRIH